MNFKTYDILSSLVPGFLVLLGLQNFFTISYDKDLLVAYTAIAFLLGYIVNTIGSWAEEFYFFTWGGKPSSNIMDGKNIWKIKVYNVQSIKTHLIQRSKNQNPNDDELFGIAMREVNGEKDSRVDDFNATYAFSRTLLTSVLLGGVLLIPDNYLSWKYWCIFLITGIILWYRAKQKAYYYCKEVLNSYSKSNNI